VNVPVMRADVLSPNRANSHSITARRFAIYSGDTQFLFRRRKAEM
jgi:hypothetical protein